MQNTFPVSNKKFEEHVDDTSRHLSGVDRAKISSISLIAADVQANTTAIERHLQSYHPTHNEISNTVLENVYPVGIVVWCKDSSACPKIGTWEVCTELIGRYPLGDSTGGLATVEAGLPNITGRIDIQYAYNHKDAFYTDGTSGTGGAYEVYSGSIKVNKFDASRCSDVYGNSDTVTPPSAKLIPYIRTA